MNINTKRNSKPKAGRGRKSETLPIDQIISITYQVRADSFGVATLRLLPGPSKPIPLKMCRGWVEIHVQFY